MEKLEHNGTVKDYNQELDDLRKMIVDTFPEQPDQPASAGAPPDPVGQLTGVKFRVVEDFKLGLIKLVISEHGQYILTLKGARDLAMALRQASNRIEKNNLQQGLQGHKKGKRK